jgi:hypothetical protein
VAVCGQHNLVSARRLRGRTLRAVDGVRPAGSDPMRARANARLWHSCPVPGISAARQRTVLQSPRCCQCLTGGR